MSAPESPTSADQALSSLMGAILNVPAPLIQAAPVQRNGDGYWTHPAHPEFEEGQDAEASAWFNAQQLQTHIAYLEARPRTTPPWWRTGAISAIPTSAPGSRPAPMATAGSSCPSMTLKTGGRFAYGCDMPPSWAEGVRHECVPMQGESRRVDGREKHPCHARFHAWRRRIRHALARGNRAS